MSKYINFNGDTLPQSGGSLFENIKTKITNNIVIIGIAVALIAGIWYYYANYISPSLAPNFKPNSERVDIQDSTNDNNTNNKKIAELMLFYADWCPHCKTAKPEWNNVKAKYENKTINGYKLIFTEVNCTNESAEVEELMDKYKIEGFPTIKMLKDGQVIEYDASPKQDLIEEFINSVL